MFMAINVSIIGVIIAAAIVIYLYVYNRNINRKLQGETAGKMLPPGLAALFTILIGFAVLITVVRIGESWREAHPTEMDIKLKGSYDFDVFAAEEIPGSWAEIYSKEENVGYTRRVEQVGDFEYIVFESEAPHDGLHPDFLIYARYTGDEVLDAMEWNGRYKLPSGENLFGYGVGGSQSEYYLVVGMASMDIDFEFTTAVYNKEDYVKAMEYMPEAEEELQNFATATGSVTLHLTVEE